MTSRWTPYEQSGLTNVGSGPQLGSGPVYPGAYTNRQPWHRRTIFRMVDPRPHDIAKPHGWLVQKVLWLVRRRYDGPVLIRGGRIGGQRRMLFDGNRSKVSQLRFSGSTQPSEVLVAAPGCYGWQIDGRGFSRMLVFRAVCVQPDKRVFRSCPTSNRSRR